MKYTDIINSIKKHWSFVVSISFFSIFLFIMSFFGLCGSDESRYIAEAGQIADCLQNGIWFGDLMSYHGWLFTFPTALLFIVFGKSVYIATLTMAVYSIISFFLCYLLFYKILKSTIWALTGTWLVFLNNVTLYCSIKYLLDIPAMLVMLLIILECISKKRTLILGVLILLLFETKEYLVFVALPALFIFILIDELWHKYNRHLILVLWRFIARCTIVFIPVFLYSLLMLFSNIVPLNIHFAELIGATKNGGIIRQIRSLNTGTARNVLYGKKIVPPELKDIEIHTIENVIIDKETPEITNSYIIKKNINNVAKKVNNNAPNINITQKSVSNSINKRYSANTNILLSSSKSNVNTSVIKKKQQNSANTNILLSNSKSNVNKNIIKKKQQIIENTNIYTKLHTIKANNVEITKKEKSKYKHLEYLGDPILSVLVKEKNKSIYTIEKKINVNTVYYSNVNKASVIPMHPFSALIINGKNISLPSGMFAAIIQNMVKIFFKLINIFIDGFNNTIIYVMKIMHPDTFSFNRLPLIIIFCAIPMGIISFKKWIKTKNPAIICFFLLFIYLPLHIMRWSIIRYLLPFFPIISLFFIYFIRDGLKRKYLTIIIIILTIISIFYGFAGENSFALIKLFMNITVLLSLVIAYLSKKYNFKYAIYTYLSIPILISLFSFCVALKLYFSHSGFTGVIRSTLDFGYIREADIISCSFPEDSTVWINDIDVDYTIGFYRGSKIEYSINMKPWINRWSIINTGNHNKFASKTYSFKINTINSFKRKIKRYGIEYIGFVESTIPAYTFKDQKLFNELANADWIKLNKVIKLKNKKLYIFNVLKTEKPINKIPANNSICSNSIKIECEVPINHTNVYFMQYQIYTIDAYACATGNKSQKIIHMQPDTLNNTIWLNSKTNWYTFNGLNDYIDCAIGRTYYKTLSLWLKPLSEFQKSVIIGHFGGKVIGDYWNEQGKGIQYENGNIYVMGDNRKNRKKLTAKINSTNWTHISVLFDKNGYLAINGNIVDSGDISSGAGFQFSIGAARKQSDHNDWNFYGMIDDVCLYDKKLTLSELSNVWVRTKSKYANDNPEEIIFDNNYISNANKNIIYNQSLSSIPFSNIPPQNEYRVIIRKRLAWDSGIITGDVCKIVIPDTILKKGNRYHWHVRYKGLKGAWSQPSDATTFIKK